VRELFVTTASLLYLPADREVEDFEEGDEGAADGESNQAAYVGHQPDDRLLLLQLNLVNVSGLK